MYGHTTCERAGGTPHVGRCITYPRHRTPAAPLSCLPGAELSSLCRGPKSLVDRDLDATCVCIPWPLWGWHPWGAWWLAAWRCSSLRPDGTDRWPLLPGRGPGVRPPPARPAGDDPASLCHQGTPSGHRGTGADRHGSQSPCAPLAPVDKNPFFLYLVDPYSGHASLS